MELKRRLNISTVKYANFFVNYAHVLEQIENEFHLL